jgi:hypothetical protein
MSAATVATAATTTRVLLLNMRPFFAPRAIPRMPGLAQLEFASSGRIQAASVRHNAAAQAVFRCIRGSSKAHLPQKRGTRPIRAALCGHALPSRAAISATRTRSRWRRLRRAPARLGSSNGGPAFAALLLG